MKFRHALAFGVALSAFSTPAFAQDQETSSDQGAEEGSEIIVTAVARGQNRLESSVSVSSVGAEQIADLAPPSSADLIRQIPGIRSEASGGEGNANIAVRGLPVSTGGARYIQLQEDGLPVLEFGDIIFGNADNFLRADRNVARVEAVRGGSASTFASNAPGGVINFISKTGQREGGAIQGTVGIDFETYRVDFDYGAPLADDLYFHVGGFYRTGEGPRDIGFNGNDGGQIKANITKEFDGGYVRFHAKFLDDSTPTILPQPVFVTGTDSNPDYNAIAGFDPRSDSLYSPFITTITTLDGGNNPTTYNFRDGLSVESQAFGVEAEVDIGSGWMLTNRFRYANNSGSFVSPFPASAGAAQDIADGIGGAGSSIVFATGPNAGSVANASNIGGNGLLTNIVNFNVRLNSLDNVTNDFRISKDFDFGGGSATFTSGFYLSRQDVDTDWLWTAHVQTVQGDGQSVLVDIVDAGFERTGRSPGSAREQIIKFVRGHPQRMMQMADAVWRHTEEGSTAGLDTWERALAAVRSSVDSGTERLYALLPTGQQKTLRAIVSGGSPYGTAADVLELPAGTATGAIESLTNLGYLIRKHDKLLVVDPLFADWIRRRFPV